MLALFYGPSGVGKTTIMSSLGTKCGARLVPTIMTRPLRLRESAKVAVTHAEFARLEAGGAFLHVNYLHGNFYGTPRDAVRHAVSHREELWLLDFPYATRHVFAAVPHTPLVILPEDATQLATQLQDCGRVDRLQDALSDYEHHYKPLLSLEVLPESLIMNRAGRLAETIERVHAILMEVYDNAF